MLIFNNIYELNIKELFFLFFFKIPNKNTISHKMIYKQTVRRINI